MPTPPPDRAALAGLSPAARALLERRAAGGAAGAGAPIPRRHAAVAPLSSPQQRIWLFEQVEPGRAVYNVPRRLRLRGALDVAALERALDELVRRHEVLRTRYAAGEDGAPVQHVEPAARVELRRWDLRTVPAAERATEALRRAEADALEPFDLTAPALPRAALFRLDGDEHLLQLTFHHIGFDGWSNAVALGELGTLYSAFAAGAPPPLPEPAIQYADFAAWQRERRDTPETAAAIAAWRSRLAGTEPLSLPRDRRPPASRRYTGGRAERMLPPELEAAVRAWSRGAGATPFMTLFAAFQVLLSRYARQTDFAIGVPVAARLRPELEPLVGCFVNTLVVPADLAGAPGFRELVDRVRRTTAEAFALAEVPLERMLDGIGPARAPGAPAVRALFNFRNLPAPAPVLAGLDVEVALPDLDLVHHDLALEAEEAGGLRLRLAYATELFEPATATRLLDAFLVLLGEAVARPETPVDRLPLLAPGERGARLDGPARPIPDRRFDELVSEQAARTPDALAIVAGERRLTYRELEERARAIERRLRAAGVGPGGRVAILLDRTSDLVPSLLGAMKAGAAYVPLDTADPPDRIAFVVGDAGVAAIVTRAGLRDRVPAGVGPVVCADEPGTGGDAPADGRADGAAPQATPASAAYAIYTSGSTGRPKGAEISHRSAVNLALSARDRFGIEASDRLLQFAALSFDTSVKEIFATLLAGGTLVLRTPAMLDSIRAFLREVEAAEITVLNLPTGFWHELVRALEADALALPARVRTVLIGGEAARPDRLAAWRRVAPPHVRLFNGYGPTETAVTATVQDLTAPIPGEEAVVPIGSPHPNVRVHVLDEHLAPLPVGFAGELCIGGAGVGLGYIGRPELTAERFLADPFAAEPGARLYRTGDLARLRPEGWLEFLGRVDAQVKIRGFRVEPGEVEAVLSAHPALAEVAVEARRVGGENRLVAYYAAAEPAPSVDALRAYLAERLPGFLVPSAFVRLDVVPRLSSGKIDRRALPAPTAAGDRAASPAPGDPLRRQIALIWRELLDVEAVGVRDDFFEIGGHSLLALGMLARAERLLGRAPSVSEFLREPTIDGIAAALTREAPSADSYVVTLQAGRADHLPLVFFHGDFVGGGRYARALAHALGPDWPVHLVDPQLPGGPATIEAMAAELLPAVRALRPGGPFFLAGVCNGGFVALEVARLLLRAGDGVPIVALLDTRGPDHPVLRAAAALRDALARRPVGPAAARRTRDAVVRALLGLEEVWYEERGAGPGARSRAAAAMRLLARAIRFLRRRAGAAERAPAPAATTTRPPETAPPPGTDAQRIVAERIRFLQRARAAYRPGRYPGRLAVLTPAESPGARRHQLRGWRRVARDVAFLDVPGDHDTVIIDHIDSLAATLAALADGAVITLRP